VRACAALCSAALIPTAPALTIATAVTIAIATKCFTAMIASIPLTIAEITSANAPERNAEKFTKHVIGITPPLNNSVNRNDSGGRLAGRHA